MKFKLPKKQPKVIVLSTEQFQFVYTDYAMNTALGVTRDELYESLLTEEFIEAFSIPKNQQPSIKLSIQFVLDMLDSDKKVGFKQVVGGINSQLNYL